MNDITVDDSIDQTDFVLCDESRLITDLRKISGGSQHRLNDWKELNQILSAAVRVHLNHNEEVQHQAKAAVDYLLHEDQLSSLWDEITSVYCLKSESAAHQAAVQVTNGYRTMANFFDQFSGFTMKSKLFSELIAKSLLRYISVNEEETKIEAVAALILLLPLDFQAILFSFMIRGKLMGTSIISYLPSKFALQTTYLFLRRKYSNRSYVLDSLELSIDERNSLEKLVKQSLKDISPAAVVDTLLMQRSFTASVAKFIVNLLPEECYIYILSVVGTLWGEKLFISKGNERAQEFMTAIIISTLRRITGSQLSQRYNDGFPIASILSSGVSAYLDQSDASSRIRGMRIAKEFSILLGQDITFEELEEADRRIAQQESLTSVTSSVTVNSSASKVIVTQTVGGNDVGIDVDDDDSSDSEIEGYDMRFEDVEDVVTLTNYLGVCLDLFLCQDTDKDAHDKQLSALLSIPKIVLTNPVDAGNVCGPLIKELLRLNNSYNTKNFEGLRSQAVLSIVVTYPHFAVPVLTWSLEEESYSLSVKIFAISCLSKAAYSLSSLSDEKYTSVNTTLSQTPTLGTSGKTMIKNGISNDTLANHENENKKTSSIIKRPAKLAQSHKKVTYFVNKFGPLGPSFFYPILRLISIEIVRNNSKNISPSNAKKNDKQKLNFFHTDFDNTDEKFLDFFSSNGLYGSSGKVPEMKKSIDDDDGDGLHSMVPTEALLALGTFCKCSVNSVYQSTFSMETMKAAYLMKDMTSLSIRRASLIALYYALESWIHIKKNKKQFSPSRVSTVLETLTDVTGQHDRSSTGGQTGSIEKEEYALVATIVDWAVLSSKQDPDESCRALKLQIVRFGIEGFGLLENDRPA